MPWVSKQISSKKRKWKIIKKKLEQLSLKVMSLSDDKFAVTLRGSITVCSTWEKTLTFWVLDCSCKSYFLPKTGLSGWRKARLSPCLSVQACPVLLQAHTQVLLLFSQAAWAQCDFWMLEPLSWWLSVPSCVIGEALVQYDLSVREVILVISPEKSWVQQIWADKIQALSPPLACWLQEPVEMSIFSKIAGYLQRFQFNQISLQSSRAFSCGFKRLKWFQQKEMWFCNDPARLLPSSSLTC